MTSETPPMLAYASNDECSTWNFRGRGLRSGSSPCFLFGFLYQALQVFLTKKATVMVPLGPCTLTCTGLT
jgi:hypothetical protein